jgi:hypothetical protein
MAVIGEAINDVDDLKEALENASDNEVFFLNPDKTYECNNDTTISVHAKNVRVIGCEPQFAESTNPKGGRAVIKGDGKLTLKGCIGLQIRGFFFRLRLEMRECEDCKIEYSDFHYDTIPSGTNRVHVLYIKDSARNHIHNCKFHDKDNEGVFLIIRKVDMDSKVKTKDNIVERCEFCNHRFDDDGGESIVIGEANQADDDLHTEISNCWFHDLNADPETVSIKACGTNIHNCLHENNDSSFTVRHGNANRIEQCIFRGRGGVRLYGKDNHVNGNYFLNNSDNDRLPITVGNGNESSGGSYSQVKNNHIRDNTFENCPTICIRWGKNPEGGGPDKPDHNHVLENKIIADDGINGCIALKFEDGAGKLHNEFEENIIYAGENPSEERKKKIMGDLPQDLDQTIVFVRPEVIEPSIDLPYQWPSQ